MNDPIPNVIISKRKDRKKEYVVLYISKHCYGSQVEQDNVVERIEMLTHGCTSNRVKVGSFVKLFLHFQNLKDETRFKLVWKNL